MSNCPNCSNALRPGAQFCAQCGYQVATPPAPSPAPQRPAPQQSPPWQPPQQPVDYPVPQPPPAWGGWQAAPNAGNHGYGPGRIPQLGAVEETTSLWGPFAGYGMRRQHVAWLLENAGAHAEELRNTVSERFQQRQIPGARFDCVLLSGQGVGAEKRPFYRIRRGLATVWLYVARFGQDLYVSQVSYVKAAIGKGRLLMLVILVGMVLLSWINSLAIYLNVQDSLGLFSADDLNGFLILAGCCTGPLGLLAQALLVFGLVFSVYKFVTEKDLLFLLRDRLNEFQEDDVVALEKAVNETVRQAADATGIDREQLAPDRAHCSGRRWI